MKKNRYLLVVCVLFVGLPTQVFAQGSSIVFGLKTWVASSTLDAKNKTTGVTLEEESEYTALVGPSLNVRYGSWFGGANYLAGEFTFKNFIGSGVDVGLKRNELDVFAGYYFLPKLAVLLGYKQLEADFYNANTGQKAETSKSSGLVLGLTGFYPIGRQSALYGTYTFAALEDDENIESTGNALEFGFASNLLNTALSYSIGLKIQVYLFDETDYEATDTFGGLAFGINYKI